MGVRVNVGLYYARALHVLIKCLTGRLNAPGPFYLNQTRAKTCRTSPGKSAADAVSFRLSFSYDAIEAMLISSSKAVCPAVASHPAIHYCYFLL